MLQRFTLFLFLLLLACQAVSASAQAAEQNFTAQYFSTEEKRLVTPVSITVNGSPLGLLLSGFNQKTGLLLRADRPLEDRRVTISTPAVPLYQVLDHLSTLFTAPAADRRGYYWKQEKEEGRTFYTLYQTSRDREIETLYRDRRKQRFLQCARDIQTYLLLDEAKRPRFRSTCPVILHLQQTKKSIKEELGLFFTHFFRLFTSEQFEQLAEKSPQFISAKPFTREELSDLILRPVTTEELDQLREKQIQLSLGQDDGFHSSRGYRKIGATLGIAGAAIGYAFDTADPSDTLQTTKLPEGTVDPLKGVSEAEKEERETEVTTFLSRVAPQVPVPVYAEVFRIKNMFPPTKKGTVTSVLDQFCERYVYGYEVKNGVCFLRSREWAEKRFSDVPERYFRQWAASLTKNKHYSMKDVVEMAHFRDEQIETIQEVTHFYGLRWPKDRSFYRLLYGLRERDFNQAETEEGYPLLLTPDQLQEASRLMKDTEIVPPLTLRITDFEVETGQGKQPFATSVLIETANPKQTLEASFQWGAPKPGLNYNAATLKPYTKRQR